MHCLMFVYFYQMATKYKEVCHFNVAKQDEIREVKTFARHLMSMFHTTPTLKLKCHCKPKKYNDSHSSFPLILNHFSSLQFCGQCYIKDLKPPNSLHYLEEIITMLTVLGGGRSGRFFCGTGTNFAAFSLTRASKYSAVAQTHKRQKINVYKQS